MLPNPADALTNPMRYWTDVWAFQIKMGQAMYDAAASVNPFLPQITFEAGLAVGPERPAAAKTPATARVTATVEQLQAPAKPAPARKPRAKAAPTPAKSARKTAAKTSKPAARKTTAAEAPAKPAPTRRRRTTTPPAKSEG